MTLHPQTRAEIEDLRLDNGPLVVCDVDEVVLSFVGGFERHIERQGHFLDPKSYALAGNVKRRTDASALTRAEVEALLEEFFTHDAGRLDLVPGAVESLAALSRRAQVVLLTNIPLAYRDQRHANLRGHGLDYPIIVNEGPKGPAMSRLAEKVKEPLFFLDDAPENLRSVASDVPQAHLIHFIADARFEALCEEVDEVHFRTRFWEKAREWIESGISRKPPRRAGAS